MLIGAGCVATVETAAVTLGEHGLAPRFTAAIKAGSIRMLDATCPAIHAALQASEKGIPFMPLRGIIGSDILAHRPDWKVGENPFAADDPIVYLPALRPDVALFHAPLADRDGNVWVGVRRELMLMAHASKAALVGYTRASAMELAERGILVNAIAPGLIDTPMLRALTPERRAAQLALQPTGKAGTPEDIAHAVSFLAGPAMSFITGQVLFVDGGKSLGGSGA